MITIINYGTGNFRSVENAFKYLGEKTEVTDKPDEIEKAEKIVLIGVGSFGRAAKVLEKKKLAVPIKKAILSGKPFLGICLGLQLLFEKSEESPGVKGLGVFKGECLKFKNVKTPQLGWNRIKIKKKSDLFKDIPEESYFYFMHSFYVKPAQSGLISAITDYGQDYCSAVSFKNIFAVQFHPEKSGPAGLQIFKNFINI
jgi:imidazole glycerol phosphate synthase glutamine amidotransferase subunit